MRLVGVLAGVCALVTGVLLFGARAHAARKKAARAKPCPPAKSQVLATGPTALAYARRGANLGDGEFDPLYLCRYGKRKHRRLGVDACFNAEAIGLIRFAGRRVLATSTVSCGPGGTTSRVVVRRVRNGSRVRTHDAAPGAELVVDDPNLTTITVPDLVLRPDGAVAWIVEVTNARGAPGTSFQVRHSTSGSTSVVAAEGADIRPRSLALAGSTLYWSDGSGPRALELP